MGFRHQPSRRAWLGALGALAGAAWREPRVHAEDLTVPADIQAELLAKVVAYDRNFAARAGATARVLVLTKRNDPASTRAAGQLEHALGATPVIGGVAVKVDVRAYEGAAAVRAGCVAEGLAVIYLTPGLDDHVAAIAEALAGADVLSVTGVARFVQLGAVLGFDLVSAKPKLLVNLPQARRQNVDFKADVLKIMRVYP